MRVIQVLQIVPEHPILCLAFWQARWFGGIIKLNCPINSKGTRDSQFISCIQSRLLSYLVLLFAMGLGWLLVGNQLPTNRLMCALCICRNLICYFFHASNRPSITDDQDKPTLLGLMKNPQKTIIERRGYHLNGNNVQGNPNCKVWAYQGTIWMNKTTLVYPTILTTRNTRLDKAAICRMAKGRNHCHLASRSNWTRIWSGNETISPYLSMNVVMEPTVFWCWMSPNCPRFMPPWNIFNVPSTVLLFPSISKRDYEYLTVTIW